jgi:hypothetical protein
VTQGDFYFTAVPITKLFAWGVFFHQFDGVCDEVREPCQVTMTFLTGFRALVKLNP